MLCVTARSGIVSREETGEPEPLVQGPEIGGPSQNIVARVVGVIAEAVLGAHRFLGCRHHLHEAHRARPRYDRAAIERGPSAALRLTYEIGRASCRERVYQYVLISVFAGYLKKKYIKK